jgi:hypothetical protein
MRSQMNALKQRLDAKPAPPQGFPTGRTIAMAGQIAPHLGNGLPEGSSGHQSGSLTSLYCHNDEKIRIEDLAGGTLRLSTRNISQLQQADGQWRQQAQQADQTGGARPLALFETASGFETLVIVLHDPAVLIPSHSLGIPARASWWGPRSTESIPRALLQQVSALPTPEWPILAEVLC